MAATATTQGLGDMGLMTIEDAGTFLGLSTSTVRHLMERGALTLGEFYRSTRPRRPAQSLTEEERAEILELIRAGATAQAIAEEFSVPQHAVTKLAAAVQGKLKRK